MVIQLPKPQHLSRLEYLRLAYHNARAQGISMDSAMTREFTNLLMSAKKAPF